MKIKNENEKVIPSFTEVRDFRSELEVDLERVKDSKSVASFKQLANKIETFLDLCDTLLNVNSIQNNKRKYADKTLDQIESWASEWNDISCMLLREKPQLRNEKESLFSFVGKLFLLRPRRNYSNDDLPNLQPAQYIRQKSKNVHSPYREYSDNDLPEYISG